MWSSSPSLLPFSCKRRVIYLKVRVLKKGFCKLPEISICEASLFQALPGVDVPAGTQN
jgi:hypothetical protein